MENTKKRILSGIQPSGILTIGHLTGALKNWNSMQKEFDSFFMIADLHSITVKQIPSELRERTWDTLAMFLACGIDPEKSTIFLQSQIPMHSQLAWILSCFTGMGECSRMTQFKDKSEKNTDNINVGLFSYPVLMACDILLYQADCVPVGEDQKQHLELTRNLAQRFNHNYSDTFTVPEPYIPKIGGRIMSLQEPIKKMSKSDTNQNASIFLTDTDDIIIKKIKRAVTDSENKIQFKDSKPGVSNLITLYSLSTGKSIDNIVIEFQHKGYGEFKQTVADAVASYISPIRENYLKIRKDKKYLESILINGNEKASKEALKTLRKVSKKVGFVQL